MKDLGSQDYFLGIEVASSDKGILLSQRKYVLALLKKTGMLRCKPIISPIEMNHRSKNDDGNPIDYRKTTDACGAD